MSRKNRLQTRIDQAVETLERELGGGADLLLSVVYAASELWGDCPDDFCIQDASSSDTIVFGGTNRVVWSTLRGFRADRSYCTEKFLERYDAIMSPVIPPSVSLGERWFGHAGHFIGGRNCRFHLCTVIGEALISTVGDYRPFAGMSDELKEKLARPGSSPDGPQEIGLDRLYETMVFRVGDDVCADPACGCEIPRIDGHDFDFEGYNTAGEAAKGHMRMCQRWTELQREKGNGAFKADD